MTPHNVLVAHQPAYLPWGGYFARLLDVDELILLDHVQFSERGYQHRNRIRAPRGGPLRLTVPVRRRFGQLIRDVRIADEPWARRHWRAIVASYRKAPYWSAYADWLESIYSRPYGHLMALTTALTRFVLDAVDLPVRIRPSSGLGVAGHRTEMLLGLARTVGADTIRTGSGAVGYLDRSRLRTEGIGLEVITYATPAHRQGPGPFTPDLSVLDMLMWTGPRTRDLLSNGASLVRETGAT